MKTKILSILVLLVMSFVVSESFANQAPACPTAVTIKTSTYIGGYSSQELFLSPSSNLVVINAKSESAAKTMLASVTYSYPVKYYDGTGSHYYYCSYAPYANVTITSNGGKEPHPPFVLNYFIKINQSSKVVNL